MRFVLIVTLLGFMTCWLPGLGAAENRPSNGIELAVQVENELSQVIEKVSRSFAFVGGGSGVVISADGYILTNYHVAGDKKHCTARLEGIGAFVTCDLIGADPIGDLALLKVHDGKDLPYLEFGTIENLSVGQRVLALGDPFKLADIEGPPAVSIGTISALHRYQGNYSDAIQTDCAINPGNSGGPLVTMDGKLVGITGQIMSRFGAKANTGIGYAVPIDQIARFLPQLKAADGQVIYHGNLPNGLTFVSHMDETQRASVEKVEEDSPAEKLGFKPGDRILSVDDKPVYNFARLTGIIRSYPDNSPVALKIERGGKHLDLNLSLVRLDVPTLPTYVHLVGVELEPPTIGEGLRVSHIDPESVAERSGLQVGDVIESVDGRHSAQAWPEILTGKHAGDRVELSVRRVNADGRSNHTLSFSMLLDQH